MIKIEYLYGEVWTTRSHQYLHPRQLELHNGTFTDSSLLSTWFLTIPFGVYFR